MPRCLLFCWAGARLWHTMNWPEQQREHLAHSAVQYINTGLAPSQNAFGLSATFLWNPFTKQVKWNSLCTVWPTNNMHFMCHVSLAGTLAAILASCQTQVCHCLVIRLFTNLKLLRMVAVLNLVIVLCNVPFLCCPVFSYYWCLLIWSD